MLFLDQRGTGMSSTISAGTLARQGKPEEQAAYLRHFRADNIGRRSPVSLVQVALI